MRDRDPDLTGARQLLQERRIAPIWRSAADGLRDDHPDAETVRRGARVRVLRYLAAQMGLDREEADPALFDLEQCREAWVLLSGITYRTVRDWATKHRAEPAVTAVTAERKKAFADVIAVLAAIPADKTVLQGEVPCPRCSGPVRWQRAPSNGHVRASCAAGCVVFMQ